MPQNIPSQTYTVQRGDSLSKIANNLGVSLQTLKQLNPQLERGKKFNLIYPGDIVNLPKTTITEPIQPEAGISPPPTPPPIPGQPGTPGEVPGVEGGITDQLQEPYKTMIDIMRQQLDELQKRGQTVNADIEITPERVAEFMRQAEGTLDIFLPYAEKEILPYYKNQLKLAREGFLRGLGYGKDQLLRTEQDIERKFQKTFQQIGESAAERGFALSGARQREEREFTEETQRGIEAVRRQFGFEAGGEARKFAQRFGTANVPEFEIQEEGRPLYELSPSTYAGITGEQEFQQRAATLSRASELEKAFRESQSIEQQRKIIT